MSNWGEPPIDLEGNQPAAIGPCSREAHLASNWIVAIDAWDYCDHSLLTEMLNRHPIPFELQPVIADIVSGKRKQNKKAAAKLKIPAGHRMIIAGLYYDLKTLVFDATLKRETLHDYHEKAEKLGIEVVELQRSLQNAARNFKQKWADSAGISIDALENMVDSIREKIKNYPHI